MNHMRFEIHRGRELNGQLVNMRLAGYAFQNEGENYYRVKLMLLPDNVYYLSKNQGHGYTLFSKASPVEIGGQTRFEEVASNLASILIFISSYKL